MSAAAVAGAEAMSAAAVAARRRPCLAAAEAVVAAAVGAAVAGGRRSDIRLKEDIVPLVQLGNGLELYRFRYKGSDRTAYVGVMAQEVQQIEPKRRLA